MPKFKHIREKRFFASHPLYDVMNNICNPTDENCGVEATYNGQKFKLDSTIDTYFDETGKPEREVMVTDLNQPEEKWTVYKKNAEELASPMYSTGVGLVIEGLARYEEAKRHGKVKANNEGKVSKIEDDVEVEVEVEPVVEETGNTDPKPGFFTRIIGRFGQKFFGEDDIDNDNLDN
jgi:hypothetical protein